MTDIEKEGELFEQWWEDEGQYHRAGGDDYCKTFAWEAWIFVKNQAIPDGFVVVPKEPTTHQVDYCQTMKFRKGVGRSHKFEDIFVYKAMIEAQEQSHV